MLKKAKKILRNESGMSIIIVLSIGALFVALSAAVLYAASTQVSSANRVLPQEDAYRMAYSFTENVLEPDLKAMPDKSHPLQTFLTETFMDPGNNYLAGENYAFSEKVGSETDEVITITLKKIKPEDADPITAVPAPVTLPFTATTTAAQVAKFNDDAYKYLVAVTVEVKVGGESYALTKRYSCKARYAFGGGNEAVYRYNSGTQFTQIDYKSVTADLDELIAGAATGYYIWLPEGGEG